jgi:hypothetical protein
VGKIFFYVAPEDDDDTVSQEIVGPETEKKSGYSLSEEFLEKVISLVEEYHGRENFEQIQLQSKKTFFKCFKSRDQACDALTAFYYVLRGWLGPEEGRGSPLVALIGEQLSAFVVEGLDDVDETNASKSQEVNSEALPIALGETSAFIGDGESEVLPSGGMSGEVAELMDKANSDASLKTVQNEIPVQERSLGVPQVLIQRIEPVQIERRVPPHARGHCLYVAVGIAIVAMGIFMLEFG